MDNLKTTLVMLILTGFLAGFGCAESESEYALEPLRNPFWPVGYFPDGWQDDKSKDTAASVQENSDWSVVEARITVKATSRMGARFAAIINDQIKEVGDTIEMIHNSRIYKWQLRRVNANGTISLDRLEVANRTIGFQPGETK